MLLIHAKGKQFAPAVTNSCPLKIERRRGINRDFHLERRHPCLLSFVKSYSAIYRPITAKSYSRFKSEGSRRKQRLRCLCDLLRPPAFQSSALTHNPAFTGFSSM